MGILAPSISVATFLGFVCRLVNKAFKAKLGEVLADPAAAQEESVAHIGTLKQKYRDKNDWEAHHPTPDDTGRLRRLKKQRVDEATSSPAADCLSTDVVMAEGPTDAPSVLPAKRSLERRSGNGCLSDAGSRRKARAGDLIASRFHPPERWLARVVAVRPPVEPGPPIMLQLRWCKRVPQHRARNRTYEFVSDDQNSPEVVEESSVIIPRILHTADEDGVVVPAAEAKQMENLWAELISTVATSSPELQSGEQQDDADATTPSGGPEYPVAADRCDQWGNELSTLIGTGWWPVVARSGPSDLPPPPPQG
eukprot:TRINITY_DN12480_c0_g1_i1.p1 TRINITY_DN12480_c0_g1~~TRINITY_DN12480_c0_g1_i1.p1  ORF type:complete len:325 (+),score=47.55 TRINITY_DN12480_c0_g1_i1:49-975(+)